MLIHKDRTRDEDPREALLKYADKAESDPYWVAPAYKECVDLFACLSHREGHSRPLYSTLMM
jgi:hypothetical protein